jgi:predicted transposase YbfD/YdcC
MEGTCRPLIEVLAEVPDSRRRRGRRHPLVAILALACTAMLCGFRSYSTIVEWARTYGPELMGALGFTRATGPSVGTLHTVPRQLDREALERKLGAWAEGVLAATPGAPGVAEGLALDGKTLGGSRKQGAPGAHLLAAVGQRLGLSLAQRAVPDETNELGVVRAVLRDLVLSGRVVTADALHTQREVAGAILAGGGDYVLPVKETQPQLLAQIADVFAHPALFGAGFVSAETTDSGHGRVGRRRLTASPPPPGFTDWPGLRQVYRIERTVVRKRTGARRAEVGYGITSLPPESADAAGLLAYTRWHWHIENRSHWVRDVTFDEDRSPVRAGSIPQVMAALRNTVIGLLRSAGERNIAAALRRLAGQPTAAMALIGIHVEN